MTLESPQIDIFQNLFEEQPAKGSVPNGQFSIGMVKMKASQQDTIFV